MGSRSEPKQKGSSGSAAQATTLCFGGHPKP